MAEGSGKGKFKKPTTVSGDKKLPSGSQTKTIVDLDKLEAVGGGEHAQTKELVSSTSKKAEEPKEKPPAVRGAPRKSGKENWKQTTFKIPEDIHFNLNVAKLHRSQKEGRAVPVEDLIIEALIKAGYDKPPSS